jgi:hypothetical protein
MNMNLNLMSSMIIPSTTRRNSGYGSPPHEDMATIPTSFVKSAALKAKDLALLKKRVQETLVYDPSTGILKKRVQETLVHDPLRFVKSEALKAKDLALLKKRVQEKLVHDPSTGEEFESLENSRAPQSEVHPKFEYHGHLRTVCDPATGEEFECPSMRVEGNLVHDTSTGEEFESVDNSAYWYTAPHSGVHPKYEYRVHLRKVRDPATGEEFECPSM